MPRVHFAKVLSHPKTAELVGIDVRALAAGRIGLALILLFDLARRMPYITAHYSDQGVMPRAELEWMTVYALNGSPLFVFVPFLTPWFRAITALSFIAFHLSLQISLELNLFCYVCIVIWLIYLPQGCWDWLASLRPAAAVSRWGGSVVDRLARGVESPLRKQRWLVTPPDDGRASLTGNVLAGVLVVYVLAWNVGSVWEPARMPPALARPGAQLAIGQNWAMFSAPPLDDGWWVMPARLGDGSEVDLFKKGGPVSWEKPPSVLKTFSTPRWRRYLEDVWNKPGVRHNVVLYAAWLRRHWNFRHPPQEQIESMRIHIEMTRPDYRPPVRSNQVIYEWSSSGPERFSTYLESIRAFAHEVSDDPTILQDMLRGAGLDESFLNE